MISLKELKEVDPSFHVHSKEGDAGEIATLCSLDHFKEGGIVFIKNRKFYRKLIDQLKDVKLQSRIGVVLKRSFFETDGVPGQLEVLDRFRFYATVESVDLALSRFSKLFYDKFNKESDDLVDGRSKGTVKADATSSIAENVFLGEGVEIGAGVIIHAGCVILSHSRIGENTVLYPNVTIYRNVVIGKNCRVHGNTTIGSDGYGYNYYEGEHLKVWHFGGVLIGDSVEIGSGTSIDQGTFSPTIIGEGTKIDNQVHLAHNCKIGKGVLITGQAGFAGSVTLGDYVAMGGCAQFAPNVVVGNYAQIGGMAGVTGDVPEKAIYAGHPARPINEWLKATATLRRLSLKKEKAEKPSGV